MRVQILKECGYPEALLGMSLSYSRPVEEMPQVAEILYRKGDEESKFLRHIDVWLYVDAPRYWWMEMAEYRIGQHWTDDWEWQSESTMHTILRHPLTSKDFEYAIPIMILDLLNDCIKCGELLLAKVYLPEGFLQARVVKTNYQALRRIIRQRTGHRLPEWMVFIKAILEQIEHKEFFDDLKVEAA